MKVNVTFMLAGAAFAVAGAFGVELLKAAVPAAYAQGGRDCAVDPVDYNTVAMKVQRLAQQGYEFKGQITTSTTGTGAFQTHIVACK